LHETPFFNSLTKSLLAGHTDINLSFSNSSCCQLASWLSDQPETCTRAAPAQLCPNWESRA